MSYPPNPRIAQRDHRGLTPNCIRFWIALPVEIKAAAGARDRSEFMWPPSRIFKFGHMGFVWQEGASRKLKSCAWGSEYPFVIYDLNSRSI